MKKLTQSKKFILEGRFLSEPLLVIPDIEELVLPERHPVLHLAGKKALLRFFTPLAPTKKINQKLFHFLLNLIYNSHVLQFKLSK